MMQGTFLPNSTDIEFLQSMCLQDTDTKELHEHEKGLMLDLYTYCGEGVRPDVSSMEEILAKEMEHLTFEEREKATFDLHGVSLSMGGLDSEKTGDGPTADTTNPVSPMELEKLSELDKELQKCPHRDSPLVKDQDFRLMFLRCDEYNVKVAAQRIQKHMKVKSELFPEECLHRPLKLSDLTPMEQLMVNSPFARNLPQRDAAGRVMFCMNHVMRPLGSTTDNLRRGAFYLLLEAAVKPEVQRDGIILVVLFTGAPLLRSSFERWKIMRITQECRTVVPRKVAGVHFCLDTTDFGNAQLQKVIPLATQLVMRRDIRVRFRQHTGNREMILLKLRSYGINLRDEDWPETAPYPTYNSEYSDPMYDNPYETDTTYHTANSRQSSGGTTDTGTTADSTTITPNDADVMLGRGRNTRTHPGNTRAAQLVDTHRSEYEAAKKFEKTAIAERIVNSIHDSGGRFLKYCSKTEQWEEVDAQTARNKISHMYRNTRKK